MTRHSERNQTKSDSLQAENQTISDFIARTDAFAAFTGLNLSEIPERLGISKAMLYAYRGGKNRVTAKVWLKLQAAEKAAGMEDAEQPQAVSTGEEEKRAEAAGNDGLEARLDRLEQILLEILARLPPPHSIAYGADFPRTAKVAEAVLKYQTNPKKPTK